MTTEFDNIPAVVFELFREIYHHDPENRDRPVKLSITERTRAMMIAWGWEPPLISEMSWGRHTDDCGVHDDPENVGCGTGKCTCNPESRAGLCNSSLTKHGIAAYCWFLDQLKNPSPEDYPAEYREDGKPDGEPLTAPYLETNPDWDLKKGYISRFYKKDGTGVLTKRIKPKGKPFAYLFRELKALRDLKTKNTDGRH